MNTVKVFLTLLVLVLLSCNKDNFNPIGDNGQNINYNRIYPLSVGNLWIYQTPEYNNPQNILTDSIRIVGKYVNDKDTIYAFVGGEKDWDFTMTYFSLRGDGEGLFYRSDSLFMFVKDKSGKFIKNFLLEFNPSVNRTDTVYYVGCGKMGLLRIISDNEVITVPAGVFTCLKLTIEGSGCLGYTIWLAKEVGIVRIKDSPYIWGTLELISYKLN